MLYTGTTSTQPIMIIKPITLTQLECMEINMGALLKNSRLFLKKTMSNSVVGQHEGNYIQRRYWHLCRALNNSSNQTNIKMSEWQSGSAIPPIYLGLFDQFGNIVKSDSESSATLSILSSNTSDEFPANLIGNTFVQAVNGIFSFTDMALTAKPGSKTCNLLVLPFSPDCDNNRNWFHQTI